MQYVWGLANTEMDKVIQKNKEMEAYGKYDMSMFLNDEKPKKKFYFYETDKYLPRGPSPDTNYPPGNTAYSPCS